MHLEIRDFTEADYPAGVAIANRAFPEYPDTADEWRHWDRHRNPKLRFRRFVAEMGGQVVAYGQYDQDEGMYHPDKYQLEITVDPGCRRQGIGSVLYDHIAASLAPLDPLAYWINVREDITDGLRFVARRGYAETMRTWENHLNMASFDPAPFDGTIENVEASGIALRTFAELRAEEPAFFDKLYDMIDEVHHDVPSVDPATSVEREPWIERVKNHPNLMPDGYFIAVDGDRYIGLSTLFRSEAADFLYTGLTGTRRAYRRRGIALALKLKALAYAGSIGCPLVKTWNASTNTGMLAINQALGFKKQPAWIFHALALRPEATDAAEVERELVPAG